MSARAVDFQSINVAADPDGLAQLRELGVRTVPVVAKGARYVMGLSLRDVGEFLGLDDQGPGMLPPEELVQRLDWVLDAAQRYLRNCRAGPAATAISPIIFSRLPAPFWASLPARN